MLPSGILNSLPNKTHDASLRVSNSHPRRSFARALTPDAPIAALSAALPQKSEAT